MAHFAQINDTNIVQQVIVVGNEILNNAEGFAGEALGVAFCQSLYGADTNWKQTSYNRAFRKNYAGIGFTYDSTRDAFIEPKPEGNWKLDEETCTWKEIGA
jgi:hypothetical protein